ncbi:MAG: LysR substrate-binding domain-containing protein [Kiloniellales bacterium]|jgi:aminoethylphosphonate catabolism LysR family transcriptional regulator
MIYTQLRSFHAVAAEGGFTAASKVLNVGQPTITSQVKALERYFNVELFHRRGRRVELSDAGHALFAVTRRIMSREKEAVDLLNAFGGFHIGHLKVGAVGPYDATEMLAAFNERYPDLKVSVTMGNSREVLDALFDFSADVAVLAQIEDDPRLLAVPYSRHPVVVFVNTDHPWAERTSIRIEELEGQSMVLRGVGSTTRRAFEEVIDRAGVTIGPVMEIGSREAVWMAVRHGIGIGVVSELEFYTDPNLRTLEISDADIYYYTHVVCLAERRESHLIRAFLEVVEELLV